MLAIESGSREQQLERILESGVFRSSDVLRRLLKFLAEKAFSGEAAQLKEYTIGVDGLGKAETYDPRKDASVRLQASRLRQKLTEYYLTEGKEDPIIFELPKGHFQLVWKTRIPTVVPAQNSSPPRSITRPPWNASFLLTAALLISLCWGAYVTIDLSHLRKTALSTWTPELEELWQPFLATGRPMIIAFSDPFFVGLVREDGTDQYYVRDRSIEHWDDARNSPKLRGLQKLLQIQDMRPNQDFALRGDMMSLFMVTKALAAQQSAISVFRLSAVSADDLSNNNVLLLGAQHRLNDMLAELPIQPELASEASGIRNLHPRSGEPTFFADESMPTSLEGEVYALISLFPGPLSKHTVVETITGRKAWASMGAAQFLTDPALVRTLVNKLKSRTGKIPQYYQVILKIKYRNGLSTAISYVMHRELTRFSRPSDRAD